MTFVWSNMASPETLFLRLDHIHIVSQALKWWWERLDVSNQYFAKRRVGIDVLLQLHHSNSCNRRIKWLIIPSSSVSSSLLTQNQTTDETLFQNHYNRLTWKLYIKVRWVVDAKPEPRPGQHNGKKKRRPLGWHSKFRQTWHKFLRPRPPWTAMATFMKLKQGLWQGQLWRPSPDRPALEAVTTRSGQRRPQYQRYQPHSVRSPSKSWTQQKNWWL